MRKSITQRENTEIISNLVSWYNEATESEKQEGKKWYIDAQDFANYLSKKYSVDLYVCACIISRLSPNNRWERNKIDAEALIKAHTTGGVEAAMKVKVCTYGANKLKAISELNGDSGFSATSPKTHAFAMNVGLNSPDHITIDKWHLRACIAPPEDGVTDCTESCTLKQYQRIESLTAQVAHSYELKGYEFQAQLWLTIKRIWNR